MGLGLGLPYNLVNRRNMPMKVTIKNENKSSEIKYPCLMEGAYGEIVFFDKEKCGLILKSDLRPIGRYDTDWHMPSFTPFTGTVELSND